jgi:pyrroloquinoline quinone biosynthesis protein B
MKGIELIVLGNVQDAGSPHIACKKECCKNLFIHPDPNRKVISLGIIDYDNNQTYLFEATPDIAAQLKALKKQSNSENEIADGIFLTHAHIGHYTGLMYLGKEATNAKLAKVYAMPKMESFLKTNGPWNQLITNRNIQVSALTQDSTFSLSSNLKVTPFLVPHRDEYSETVGYKIHGPNKSILFIPDIDKWSKWNKVIQEEIEKVDYAFIDGTFYDGEEINDRNISEIPHPFVIKSMELFSGLPEKEKNKIYFIHFNHTNPLLIKESPQSKEVKKNGFNVARYLDKYKL